VFIRNLKSPKGKVYIQVVDKSVGRYKDLKSFGSFSSEIVVNIDAEKRQQNTRWDGLKGYLTNAKLSNNEIIENYQNLWQIEKAFRIAKTDLKIRPVFHRL
jgi:transposase